MTTTRLAIGAHETSVQSALGELRLAIGFEATAAAHFHHHPPAAVEFERAIDAIEEEVMKARAVAGSDSSLVVEGGTARELAIALGGAESATLEAVETLFQQLAAASLGQTAARHSLPAGGRFAAALLILREFMHHLGFSAARFDVR
jgi:exopolyphosphatase/pppGpp-phosphohydrolase